MVYKLIKLQIQNEKKKKKKIIKTKKKKKKKKTTHLTLSYFESSSLTG